MELQDYFYASSHSGYDDGILLLMYSCTHVQFRIDRAVLMILFYILFYYIISIPDKSRDDRSIRQIVGSQQDPNRIQMVNLS